MPANSNPICQSVSTTSVIKDAFPHLKIATPKRFERGSESIRQLAALNPVAMFSLPSRYRLVLAFDPFDQGFSRNRINSQSRSKTFEFRPLVCVNHAIVRLESTSLRKEHVLGRCFATLRKQLREILQQLLHLLGNCIIDTINPPKNVTSVSGGCLLLSLPHRTIPVNQTRQMRARTL